MSSSKWKESKISDLIEIIGGEHLKQVFQNIGMGVSLGYQLRTLIQDINMFMKLKNIITEFGLNNSSTKLL